MGRELVVMSKKELEWPRSLSDSRRSRKREPRRTTSETHSVARHPLRTCDSDARVDPRCSTGHFYFAGMRASLLRFVMGQFRWRSTDDLCLSGLHRHGDVVSTVDDDGPHRFRVDQLE